MLARTTYPKDYINAIRGRVARQLEAFDAANPAEPFASEALLDMVLVLELAFVHRLRKNEGKDGNPINEVRMLAASILENDGVLAEDKTIKWSPGKSVTGIAIGQRISLDRPTFGKLADAFFAEMEKKYLG